MPDGIFAFLAGLGLPHLLLWVLTFAVVFAVLTKLKVFGRAPATLISIVAGVFVLMAVPAALVTVIAGMSTGLVAVAIGVITLIALLEIAGAKHEVRDKDGNVTGYAPWTHGHGTAMAAIMIVVALLIFNAVGGLALLGISIPTFGYGTWLLILVGIAVLWMMSESPKAV